MGLDAKRRLVDLECGMPNTHPGAAASLREGMAETLTVLRLGVPPTLARTLRSTNAIESMIFICRTHFDPNRTAVRHGHELGSVTLGGRRVPVSRPRVRATDGSGEVPVPSYELFAGTELLGTMAMERMLAGLSTRRYPIGLEPVGEAVTASARSTSKSAVSRKFVAMTETALAELLAADLSGLDLVALMIDGVHFGESVCVVALGIDSEGSKHPLALAEGSTENATVVTDLLTGLRERGLGRDPPDPGRHRRREGVAQGRNRRLRPPGDPALPAAQDAQRPGPATAAAARPGRQEDARGLPRRLRPRGRGGLDRAGPRAGLLSFRAGQRAYVGLHQRLHHLQAGAHGQRQQALAHRAGDRGHRHAYPLRHDEPSPAGVSILSFWYFLVTAVPCQWCLGGRPTPTSRPVRAGDRHLNFHETRDNLQASRQACER
jgi:hypothetical protein